MAHGTEHGRDRHVSAHDGVELAVTEWGDAGAPGVLLLHGFGQSRGAWAATASRLAARGRHVLAADLRGHGDSDWAADYRFADFERDVELLVRLFGAPPVVVGASMGGILALLTEGRHRHATAVVLVDVVPDFDLDAGRRVQDFMGSHRDGFGDITAAEAAVRDYLPGRTGRDGRGLLRNLREDPDGRLRWKWDPRFADGVSWLSDEDGEDLEAVAARMSARMSEAASVLEVPTLLVRGQLSDFVPTAAADRFADLVPHARVVTIDRAGHMVAGDSNDAFTGAIIDFLEDVAPATA